ncbi:MAG: YggS family pyridoxal phosphate-dependent enzyme [Proteobacteria bacterium]|nr:YggS family pyridoxal phosphate-dependent enzyme [Pseudomonadota bacterium]
MSLEKRYKTVLNRIKSSDTELLAVSKKQAIEKIQSLYQLGHRKFAESYVQEAVQKIGQLNNLDIQWHFIGPIQSNKTKYIAQYFDWVQSVDSIKLLTRLNNHRSHQQDKLNVLLQLKVGDEESKRGFNAQELLLICQKFKDFERLKIRGLMSIPAPTRDYFQQIKQFKECQAVFQGMQKIIPVDTLSMGMSGDLEAAVECGSTMVRVGTDVFGERD